MQIIQKTTKYFLNVSLLQKERLHVELLLTLSQRVFLKEIGFRPGLETSVVNMGFTICVT